MVKFGVVGGGYWGSNLIRSIRNVGESVEAVCDASRAVALSHSIKDGMSTYTRYQDLLDDDRVEVIVIATPAKTHYKMAQSAMLAGKHVLVEKPLGMNSVEAATLRSCAFGNNRILANDLTFTFDPTLIDARRVIMSKTIGEPYHLTLNWESLGPVRFGDVSVFEDLAVHPLSLASFLLGSNICEVSAFVPPNFEGQATECWIHGTTFSGASVTVHADLAGVRKERSLMLKASKGKLIWIDGQGGEYALSGYQEATSRDEVFVKESKNISEFGPVFMKEIRLNPRTNATALENLIVAVASAAREGEGMSDNLERAVSTMQVIDAAKESVMKGGCEIV